MWVGEVRCFFQSLKNNNALFNSFVWSILVLIYIYFEEKTESEKVRKNPYLNEEEKLNEVSLNQHFCF